MKQVLLNKHKLDTSDTVSSKPWDKGFWVGLDVCYYISKILKY